MPGKRSHKITIKNLVWSDDGDEGVGNQIATPVVLGTAWASIESVSSREYFAAAQAEVETTHKIAFRKPRFSVTASCVIEYKGRRFDIQSPPLEKGADLVLVVREKG